MSIAIFSTESVTCIIRARVIPGGCRAIPYLTISRYSEICCQAHMKKWKPGNRAHGIYKYLGTYHLYIRYTYVIHTLYIRYTYIIHTLSHGAWHRITSYWPSRLPTCSSIHNVTESMSMSMSMSINNMAVICHMSYVICHITCTMFVQSIVAVIILYLMYLFSSLTK